LGRSSNTWSGNITLQRTAGFSVPVDAGVLNLAGFFDCCAGVISGPGGITKTGPGTLMVSGFSANTFSGATVVNGGLVEAGRFNGLALPGDVRVSGSNSVLHTRRLNQFAAPSQLSPTARVTVSEGTWRVLETNHETIRALTGNGLVSIQGSLTVDNAAPVEFAGALSGLGTFTKRGAGTMRLTSPPDNVLLRFFGLTVVEAGVLEVNTTHDKSLVQLRTGARLHGTGRVGAIDLHGTGSGIAPGRSPGILTCGHLNPDALGSGTLQLELNGIAPGSGYDQLDVLGTVTLSDISLSASLNFVSAISNQFVIIRNDGSEPVSGRFTGLAEGAIVTISGEQFAISYNGGDGNDVVLTQLTQSILPTLRIERAPPVSVRLIWPTNAVGFALQLSANLHPTGWTNASSPPGTVGTNNVLTNAAVGAQMFYRLAKP
jgi:fibronectin-binding autotransporter adhesin